MVWRWDRRHTLDVRLSGGGLATLGERRALSGGNALAVRGPDGLTEIIIARRADLIGPGAWRLGDLLRGLAGTEDAAMRPLAPGPTSP